MSNQGSSHTFEPLTIPRKEVPLTTNRYRIYKDAKDFIVQEAASALEALQKSGLQQALRIERDNLFGTNIIDLEKIAIAPPALSQAAAAAPAAPEADKPAEAREAAKAEAPREAVKETSKEVPQETPLSTEDVDKLLNGGDKPTAAS